MSTVRMCDRCGRLFSEREDGWQSMTATRNVRDPKNGNIRQVTEQLDACASCSGSAQVPQPTIPQLDDPWAEQDRERRREEARREGAASED